MAMRTMAAREAEAGRAACPLENVRTTSEGPLLEDHPAS